MSATMVDNYHSPHYGQLPPRKPLPRDGGRPQSLQPFTQPLPDQQQQSSHSRTRTSSSSVFPPAAASATYGYPLNSPSYQPSMHQQYTHSTRRTLSNATASTSSTNASGGIIPQRTNSGLRRSSSSRSGNSPTSYVALMRKQKATVWCDRAQHEDPRLLAQQRAAKMRAAMEVVGGNQSARTSTSSSGMAAGVRSKIRHHGAPKASLYAPANLSAGGVPMRLSASEVDEGDSDDGDSQRASRPYHHRTGSGRSSLSSGRKIPVYGAPGRFSTSSTPPSHGSQGEGIDELEEETPMPGHYQQHRADYFNEHSSTGLSGGSGSSGERENSFGNLGQMPQRQPQQADEGRKTSDELRRRGSVDDRTMTMSGAVRLFVANPDLSD